MTEVSRLGGGCVAALLGPGREPDTQHGPETFDHGADVDC